MFSFVALIVVLIITTSFLKAGEQIPILKQVFGVLFLVFGTIAAIIIFFFFRLHDRP